jgi:glycosyltransferase involved in cell wall biosynthesis
MRICIVMEYHPDDLTGGAEVQVLGLARQFAKAGHDVVYLCQRYDRSRPLDETIDGVRVLRALRWHKVFRFLVARDLFGTLRKLRPELLYQRSAQHLTGLTGFAARALSVPFVWSCSQDESLEPEFLVERQSVPSRRPGRLLKGVILSANARINQRLFYSGLRRADALVVQNRRQLGLLANNFGLTGQLVPNGVSLPGARGSSSPEPTVLWLNRVSRGKNAEAFIKLARSMQAERPGTRFVLVGGRQRDSYMREIEQLSTGVPNLTLTGMVPHSEVQDWLARAWVFVLTSVDEGFPNVLLEAWASGTPVVSLKVDPDGLMEQQGLGLLSGIEDNLQRDVARLLDDACLRERLASAARTYVTEHLEFGVVAERYLALFQTLVAKVSA